MKKRQITSDIGINTCSTCLPQMWESLSSPSWSRIAIQLHSVTIFCNSFLHCVFLQYKNWSVTDHQRERYNFNACFYTKIILRKMRIVTWNMNPIVSLYSRNSFHCLPILSCKTINFFMHTADYGIRKHNFHKKAKTICT